MQDIPYKHIWSDDIYWLPLPLEGKKFEGQVLFGSKDEVVECSIKPV